MSASDPEVTPALLLKDSGGWKDITTNWSHCFFYRWQVCELWNIYWTECENIKYCCKAQPERLHEDGGHICPAFSVHFILSVDLLLPRNPYPAAWDYKKWETVRACRFFLKWLAMLWQRKVGEFSLHESVLIWISLTPFRPVESPPVHPSARPGMTPGPGRCHCERAAARSHRAVEENRMKQKT